MNWPVMKEEVPPEIRNYFHLKEELTIQDGILFKGNRVIVPAVLRSYMVKKVHSSHIGVEGCLRKARDVLYWPGMSAEIKYSISKCDICNTYQTNQQKEPLIPHDPPKRPWSHVATDLFNFDKEEWFIIVDYWSDYFELNQLPDPPPPPQQVLLSSPSRTSLFAMAYQIHFTVTTGHSSHPESSRNLQQPGSLITRRHPRIIPSPMGR